MELRYEIVETLKQRHSGWRLLRSDHAALVVCFLHRAFLAPEDRLVAEDELAERLTSLLHEVQADLEPPPFPRPPREYLLQWAEDGRGWLRRFYPEGSDDPHFEPTADAEAAVAWVAALEKPAFVGTESRLRVLISLVDQLYEGRQEDPRRRLDALQEKRAALNEEIERVESGNLSLLDNAAVRDRFQEVERQARQLLTDFRAVEENFRGLERGIREKITLWSSGKGALLDEVLGERDAISGSDQGRSFRAFYEFLMDPDRRNRLEERLDFVMDLQPISGMQPPPDPRLRRIHHGWIQAGARTQRTVAELSARLRRFVDDRGWVENRRILELVQRVERRAVDVRGTAPADQAFMTIAPAAARVRPPFERRLHTPATRARLRSDRPAAGEASGVSLAALGRLSETDRRRLAEQLDSLLEVRGEVTLAEAVAAFPLRHGLAELIGYLQLAAERTDADTDEAARDAIGWRGADGVRREAVLPRVSFGRGRG